MELRGRGRGSRSSARSARLNHIESTHSQFIFKAKLRAALHNFICPPAPSNQFFVYLGHARAHDNGLLRLGFSGSTFSDEWPNPNLNPNPNPHPNPNPRPNPNPNPIDAILIRHSSVPLARRAGWSHRTSTPLISEFGLQISDQTRAARIIFYTLSIHALRTRGQTDISRNLKIYGPSASGARRVYMDNTTNYKETPRIGFCINALNLVLNSQGEGRLGDRENQ